MEQRLDDKVIELPKYTVEETPIMPPPESWSYARIPGYEVLSNESEKNTKQFLRDFQLLRQVAQLVWPTAERMGPAGPLYVIICGGQNSFGQFLGKVEATGSIHYNSLFYEDNEASAIIVDYATSEVQAPVGGETMLLDDETGLVMILGRQESDPVRAFRVQYFRHLLRRTVRNAPEWYEEGMAQLCASVDYSKDRIDFGRVGHGFGASRGVHFGEMLAGRGMMNLSRMFGRKDALDHDERYIWTAQNYAFVHMCLYGMNGRYMKAFSQLVSRCVKEPMSEELFRQCFGFGYAEMETEIRGYLDVTDYKYQQYAAKKGQLFAEPAEVTLKDASDSEVGRIKGEAFRLAGKMEEARVALIAPYVRGERDSQLLAALGIFEFAQGKSERAKKYLEAAFKAGSVRPKANYELARLRYSDAMAASKTGALSAQQVGAILQPLYILRNQNNRMPEVYELFAEALLIAEGRPVDEGYRFVMEGAVRFPARTKLVYLAASLSLRTERWQEAKALVDHGLKYCATDEVRKDFAALRKLIPVGSGP